MINTEQLDKPVYVCYHAYLDGNFKLIIQDQLQKVFMSGLYDCCTDVLLYFATPTGKESNKVWLEKITKPFSKIKLIHINVDRELYPADYRESKISLQQVQQHATEHDAYYCFFHTKAITNTGYEHDMWRISCDWHTIIKWKDCVQKLAKCDAVGPNLRYNTFIGYHPHFSCNYWWSTSTYIRTLDPIYLSDTKNKYLEEFWIGSNYDGKLLSSFECGHDAPYMTFTEIDKFII